MNIHTIYKYIFKIWRVKRFRLFVEKLSPNKEMCLLDVGGYPASWTVHSPVIGKIDVLNIHPIDWNPSLYPEHNIKTIIGDGCHLNFSDESYDIVFSNSVIEHVGSWENQKAFAKEMRRVGKKIWVQTPAKECPIEPHYMAPFIHWLPKDVQRKVVRYFTIWGILQKPDHATIEGMINTTRLITYREMKELFPDCKIIKEKLFGVFPKSYIAYRV